MSQTRVRHKRSSQPIVWQRVAISALALAAIIVILIALIDRIHSLP